MQEVDGKPFEVLDSQPDHFYKAKGKWRQIFDPLKYDQTVKMEFDTIADADRTRRLASNAIRQVKEAEYCLECRIHPENGKFVLYMRKCK